MARTPNVDITGLDRAAVLAALYNRARPQGLGYLHFTPEDMTVEEARSLFNGERVVRLDYLKGRVMKVSVDEDRNEIYVGAYDRDNGEGAAESAVAPLRAPRPA